MTKRTRQPRAEAARREGRRPAAAFRFAATCFVVAMASPAVAGMAPVEGAVLNADVWGGWIGDGVGGAHPDFTQFFNVAYGGALDQSNTYGDVTMTLNGTWGGRNRQPNPPDVPPDFTDSLMLRSWGGPWDSDGVVGTSDRTVTVSGLVPSQAYDTSLWAYESQDGYGFDVLVNGALVVDNFVIDSSPTHNDDNRMDFQATADGAGVVVFTYTDPTTTSTVYKINGIRMTPIPEPGSLVLLALGTLGLVVLRRRK